MQSPVKSEAVAGEINGLVFIPVRFHDQSLHYECDAALQKGTGIVQPWQTIAAICRDRSEQDS